MTKVTCTMALAALVLLPGRTAAFGRQVPQGGTPPTFPSHSGSSQSGDDPRTARHSKSEMKGASDQEFVKKAAQGGLAEVKLGELAQEKGSNSAVKDFGKRMANDHKMADDQLTAAASKENMTVPADLDRKDQALYDRLSNLSGDDFDRAYAREMVKDHQKDVAEFQREAQNGKDPAIKNFAAQTLPTLQDHLRQAHEMLETLSQGSSKAMKGRATGPGNK
jgi:putative membrane protein